jgi:drug/metabolite transporter (DMT)-like permease
MVAAAVLFGLMAWLTKHATRRLPGAEAAFVRFTVGTVVGAAQALVRGAPLRPNRWDLLVTRGVLGAFAVLLYFMAIERIPVGTATLLHYTAPIWTALFAAAFLREPVRPATALALAVAVAGVGLVVRGQGAVLGAGGAWAFLALGSAVISGAAVTSIRAARRWDGAWEIFLSMCVIGMICTAPPAFASWQAPTPVEWFLLLSVGVVSVAAQMFMTHAFGVVEAATGGIVQQLTVITAITLGMAVDGERLGPLAAVGAALTLGGVSLAARVRSTT